MSIVAATLCSKDPSKAVRWTLGLSVGHGSESGDGKACNEDAKVHLYDWKHHLIAKYADNWRPSIVQNTLC